MGYLRPTAIIVSGSYGGHLAEAHGAALGIFGAQGMEQLVSTIVDGVANSEQSFLVAWDGSKEGWDPSDVADGCRAEFVAWLRAQAYDDGSSPLDWVELQYGGDDGEVAALADGDETRRAARV